jgi:hypothetical protein
MFDLSQIVICEIFHDLLPSHFLFNFFEHFDIIDQSNDIFILFCELNYNFSMRTDASYQNLFKQIAKDFLKLTVVYSI